MGISSGLTAGGGQHIITPDEYGGGPLGLHGTTARNDNNSSSGASSGSRIHHHLKVVTETEAAPCGGGKHWSVLGQVNVIYQYLLSKSNLYACTFDL